MVLGRLQPLSGPAGGGAAISNVVLGTFGAVLGPVLIGPMGSFASSLGMDELAGAYIATLILFAISSVVVFAGLRPTARSREAVAAANPDPAQIDVLTARPISRSCASLPRQVAVSAMALAGDVVAIMVITSSAYE